MPQIAGVKCPSVIFGAEEMCVCSGAKEPLGVIYSFIISEYGPDIMLHARVCDQFRLADVPMKCTQLLAPFAATKSQNSTFFLSL
jgi:hypothetical protein